MKKIKETEKALKLSEAKYRTLFETMLQGVVYQAADGTIISANKAAERILGLSLDQIMGRTSIDPRWKAIHEDGTDFPVETHPVSIALKTGKEIKNVVMGIYNPKNESYCWINVCAVPQFKSGAGKPYQVYTTFDDITESRQAQEALRESKERLNRAELASLSGNWELHLDTGTIAGSEGASKIYGLDKNQFEYSAIKEIVLAEFRPLLDAALKELVEENLPYDVEFKIRKVDTGEIKDIHSQATFNPEKRTVFGIIQDITEQKKVELALKESEEKFREMADMLPQIVFETDAQGNFVFVNKQAFKIFGYPEDYEIAGLNSVNFHAEEERARVIDNIRLCMAGQQVENNEYKMVRRDGSTFQALVYSSSIVKENTPIGLRGIIVDISERKQAEDALRASEEIFNQFMEHSPIYIFFKDENIRSMRLSRNYEKLLGKKLDESLGKSMNELFPSDLAKQMVEDDLRILKLGEKVEIEEELNNRCYSTIKFPIQVEGKPRFLAGFTMDITERKQAEEALKENEARLREAVATRDKFFSIIAHDLKNPFNSILGFSDLLAEQVSNKNYEGIEEYSAIIRNSSQRVMDLLMNLLEWSLSQTGRMEYNPEFVELHTLINQVCELMEDASHQKSITIELQIPLNFRAIADKAMISTTLRNLISNAVKFTKPGGLITISVGQKEEELIVSIADNGVGIKKELIDNLFKVEESYSTAGTQKEMGTGLGLILCKEFIGKHGGRIWAESELGKGSTFYFTLPPGNS
jgi:PAS domain S-box-containing protein